MRVSLVLPFSRESAAPPIRGVLFSFSLCAPVFLRIKQDSATSTPATVIRYATV